MSTQSAVHVPPRLDEPTTVDLTDHVHLRRAMGRFATGVTVVTTRTASGKLEGVTANSFATVSLDPPLVLWSLARKAASFAAFESARSFAVNILRADQIELGRHFATRRLDKLSGIAHRKGVHGCPILSGGLAYFECERYAQHDGGDHLIMIGLVHAASYGEGEPLVFAGGEFMRTAPISR